MLNKVIIQAFEDKDNYNYTTFFLIIQPFCQGKQCCQFDFQEENNKKSNSGDFSDPIYKEISLTNGYINRMNREELRTKLAEFRLDTR